MQIRDALLPEYDHELATTRKLLERVPDGKFDWKPHVKSMTIGRLSNHLAEMAEWLDGTIRLSEIDLKDFKPEPPRTTTKDLLTKFDNGVVAGRAALADATDETMMQNWTMRHGDTVMFILPRVAVVRTWVFNHLVHHRGQLSVYLRLLEVPVPSIYGPSADES